LPGERVTQRVGLPPGVRPGIRDASPQPGHEAVEPPEVVGQVFPLPASEVEFLASELLVLGDARLIVLVGRKGIVVDARVKERDT